MFGLINDKLRQAGLPVRGPGQPGPLPLAVLTVTQTLAECALLHTPAHTKAT